MANGKASTLYVKKKCEELEEDITDDMFDFYETQQNTTNSRVWEMFCWKNITFFIAPKIKGGLLEGMWRNRCRSFTSFGNA